MLNKVLFFVFALVLIGSTIFGFLYLNGSTIPDDKVLPSDDSMCKGNRIENAKWNRFSKQKTVETAEAVSFQFSRCAIQLHEYELEDNSKKCQRNRDVFYFLANHGSVDLQQLILWENLTKSPQKIPNCYAVPILVEDCVRWVNKFSGVNEIKKTSNNTKNKFKSQELTDQEVLNEFFYLNEKDVDLYRAKTLSACKAVFKQKE